MTCQIPEEIDYQNQTLPCYSDPLRKRLPEATGINVGVCDSPYPFEVSCSALWRGYIGHWRIDNNRLYLVELKGTRSDGKPASLATIFPDSSGPVFADWYTGKLVCPRGKVIGRIDDVFLNVYEEDVVLRVMAGIVRSTKIKRNKVPIESNDEASDDGIC